MAKKIAGFDIGNHALHIAVKTKKGVKRIVTEPLPEGMVREDRIVSFEALADFIKETCKKRKVRFDEAAIILPSGLCFCRRMNAPLMTHEQLMVNLPYEFRDFITAEKEAYFYDYAVLNIVNDEEGTPNEMDMMAAACLKTTVHDYRDMFRRAGIKLATAIPIEMAYTNIMENAAKDDTHTHCIVDLGHTAVRLHMFSDGKYESSHMVEYGCSTLDDVIADAMHVDPFVAASYREANHDDCQSLPECMEIYQNLANEIQRAIYFFRYNNSEVELEHIHLTGGGARIQALRDVLSDTLSVPVYDCSEFLDTDGLDIEFALGAVGAALQ